jgi:hypothetical protein
MDKKSHVIAWVATLPADDPRLALIDKMRLGVEAEPPERLLPLKDLSLALGKSASWLTRLEIQKHCGHRLAGSYRYRLSEVSEFLASEACAVRIAELHARRMTGATGTEEGGPNER